MPSETRRRIAALDVVRGFALCGILLANIRPIANLDGVILQHGEPDSPAWIGLFVEQRFFPIFATLFGVGFSLLVGSAADRTTRPRVLLLRRLLVLLAVGLAHMFLLWRGDVLTYYALSGLLVLLPSTWLPRWAVALLAVAVCAVTIAFSGGGYMLSPGLVLAGSALVRYGVIDRIETSTRGPAVVGLVLAAAAVPALWAQERSQSPALFAVAGLLIAGVYCCALLLLLRTRLRAALQTLFAPLGRMALTNYLSATALVLTIAHLYGRPQDWSWPAVYLITGGILALQWAWSTLWLRHHLYGPLEWLWRWATWLRRPPLSRRWERSTKLSRM
ncbi:DUF418 domain-containing protein [Nonomuraea sediminis]|uniref:DUF418 domain-containing protein n=1 Tax=Nonomuraea sediminis TaxID=2835864 RepID=UPI001BDC647E|nr:DUF418 domain-containing protein [Nonomuraea sediminis]